MSYRFDPVLRLQLPLIAKIIRDETWLEAERRGCHVSPHDPVVRARVCEIVLRLGAQMRTELSRRLPPPRPARPALPLRNRRAA